MPELRNENDGEQVKLPKKLSWDEIGIVMKKGYWRKATRKYQKNNQGKNMKNM